MKINHYEIKTPMTSYYIHNEHRVLESVIEKLQSGINIAMISDAGTPAISDPGHVIVKACLENNIAVESLPGPTAFIPALINSGFPTDSFIFEGFLPHKKGRKTKVESLIDEPRTVILYESPHRMHKLLEEFNSILGEDRNISVSREITKKFEETITGTVNELLNHFTNTDPRGEFVVVVEGIRKKKVKVNKYKQD